MFNAIKFQDDLVAKMLSSKSFTNLFAGNSRANAGYSQQGRRRMRRAAREQLESLGYSSLTAEMMVGDAEDIAKLHFNAEG